MQKETKEMLRELAYYSSLGLEVALCIFIGLFIGLLLDKWLGTEPWCMFIFLGLGIVAAFLSMLNAMKKSRDIK